MATAKDSIRDGEFKAFRFPKIRGHVKVTLHNPRTGKNEIQEADNIVTNALADIFSRNFMGAVDASKILPLASKWFGGLLYYEQPWATIGDPAHPDPADYFPPINSVNALKGHAGETTPTLTDLQEDRTRGYKIDEVITAGKMKQVFEWTSLQGNGVVSSLALCHSDTGDAGTGSASTAFHNFQPFEIISSLPNMNAYLNSIQNAVAQYDDSHALMFYIGEDGSYRRSSTIQNTYKVSVYIRKLAFSKFKLFEQTTITNTQERKFTVTTSVNFRYQPSYYFDYENKRLWLFTNITESSGYNTYWDKQNIQYTVIDCENGTEYAHGTIQSDAADLAPLSMDYPLGLSDDYDCPTFFNIPKIGNYFYFPTTAMASPLYVAAKFDVNGLKKINIANTGDQSTVTMNETSQQWGSAMTAGGLIVKSGRIINGATGYTCADLFGYNAQQYPSYAFCQPNGISTYAVTIGGSTEASRARYILANKLAHTTRFNLPEAITKDNTKTLTVEYTLEEEEPEE